RCNDVGIGSETTGASSSTIAGSDLLAGFRAVLLNVLELRVPGIGLPVLDLGVSSWCRPFGPSDHIAELRRELLSELGVCRASPSASVNSPESVPTPLDLRYLRLAGWSTSSQSLTL